MTQTPNEQQERFVYAISRCNKLEHLGFPGVAEKISDLLYDKSKDIEDVIELAEKYINRIKTLMQENNKNKQNNGGDLID